MQFQNLHLTLAKQVRRMTTERLEPMNHTKMRLLLEKRLLATNQILVTHFLEQNCLFEAFAEFSQLEIISRKELILISFLYSLCSNNMYSVGQN